MQGRALHGGVRERLGRGGDPEAGENEGENDSGTTHGILQRNQTVAASNQGTTSAVTHVDSFAPVHHHAKLLISTERANAYHA
ncbi:hypothetical protein GCM10025331_85440 [Actinoplanes utahensis]|nr:hypothetical protein Aut01nite_85310 [Actinoplanes utahensis]